MKEYGAAFLMTQSMFCALPFPCKIWEEKARNKMLLFLPVIGLEIGFLWFLLNWILESMGISKLVAGFLMSIFPYLITGFIHLDGYLDVTDAICSWRDLEERRRILKDSHVGAFAVIWCVLILLAGFSLFSSVSQMADSRCLILVPVISRCCSALAVLNLKAMQSSQYAGGQECAPKWHSVFLIILVVCCTLAGFVYFGKYGFVLAGGLTGYVFALVKSYRSLKGMNGDISGYCLIISELCAVAVYALL